MSLPLLPVRARHPPGIGDWFPRRALTRVGPRWPATTARKHSTAQDASPDSREATGTNESPIDKTGEWENGALAASAPDGIHSLVFPGPPLGGGPGNEPEQYGERAGDERERRYVTHRDDRTR